jgi:predicted membrane-bound spermidine synthase
MNTPDTFDPSSEPTSRKYLAVAIGFTTCATLLFEVALTRIFSLIFWYHYGFVVISLTLLGIGLSGIFVYLYPERFPRSESAGRAATASIAFAIATVGFLTLFHWLVSTTPYVGTSELLIVFLMTVVPFFFGGLAIAIPLSRFTERIGTLYGADLLGAAIGAGLVIPLLALFGGHQTLLVAACIAAGAAILFARAQQDRTAAIRGTVALAICLTTWLVAASTDAFQIRYSKNQEEKNVVYERWNSFSRVAVLETDLRRGGWNLSPKAPPGGIDQRKIMIDGGAMTPLLAFKGDFDALELLRYDVSSLGYQIRPQNNVVIIGAGGGRDILTARSFGVENIHAVEINPIIVDYVRNHCAPFCESAYDLPGVTHSVMDGRSYLATATEKFDHVQLSAVDTVAASAAGALALVEQSLYTKEAFLDYFDHLTDDGLVSITRPFNTEDVGETLRMADIVRAAWGERGIQDPAQHFVMLGRREATESKWGLLLVSKRPFDATDLGTIERLVDDLDFRLLYAPGRSDNLPEILQILGPNRDSFLDDFEQNVAATTDDKPFFFYFRKPGTALLRAFSIGSQFERQAVVVQDILLKLLFFIFGLTFLTAFGIPMALGRLRLREARGSGVTLTYFAGIGLGFMLTEIALLQRFTLLLGRPVYAFAVILGTMLVFGGIGSFLSHRVGSEGLRRFNQIGLLAILAGIAIHAWFMPFVLSSAMHWDLGLRLGLTVLTIAPLATAMGIALPSGMRLIERSSPQVLAWAWGVNGSMSVLGTVSAMAISVFFGITSALIVAMFAYGLSLLTPWKLADQPSSQ